MAKSPGLDLDIRWPDNLCQLPATPEISWSQDRRKKGGDRLLLLGSSPVVGGEWLRGVAAIQPGQHRLESLLVKLLG